MKPFLTSISCGTAITLLPGVIHALLLNHLNGVVALWLYDPAFLIGRVGFGPACAEANSVSEKVSCLYFGLAVDLVVYPLSISLCSLMVYGFLFRRKDQARLAEVE
jgi:hypothetical protein